MNPPAAPGQDPLRALQARIEALERRIAQLEHDHGASADRSSSGPERPPSGSPSTGWKERQNWRKLKKRQTEDQVRAILGEPRRIERSDDFVTWYYAKQEYHSTVQFYEDRLDAWDEPEDD